MKDSPLPFRLLLRRGDLKDLYDENTVIKSILSGDYNSFGSIVEHYQGLVFSICLNMTGDRFEAENLSQDIFIKIFNSLSTYEFRGFKTWITRVAVNRCMDFKRQAARRREEPVSPDNMELYCHELGPPVEELILRAEEAGTVRKVCDALPEIYRTVITEYFIKYKSIRQISTEMGISYKTVETRLYRGLKLLGERWKEGYT